MTTPAQMTANLQNAMYSVRGALPGQAGATVTILSTKVTQLERRVDEAARILLSSQCNYGVGCAGLLETLQAANTVLRQGQQGVIAFARAAAGTVPTPPPVPTPPVGGSGGSGGGGLPAQPPPVEPPSTWESLFGGDSPWYQRPGYLISGAVALGAVAIVLATVGGRKKPAAEPRQEA